MNHRKRNRETFLPSKKRIEVEKEKEDRGRERKREGKGKRKDVPSVTSKKRRNQWFTEREERIHTVER